MRPALLRALLVGSAAIVLTVTAAFAPLVLRRVPGFRVQRVELIGAHHLSPDAAITAAGVTAESSVFDDHTSWQQSLLAHPLVMDVTIERRLPHTIVLRIREAVPLAFARTPELRPIDERGRVLPADAAAEDMDLPVLTVRTRVSAQGMAVDTQTLRIAAFLGVVARDQPELLTWISEVGVHAGAMRLVLRSAADAEVLVTPQPTPERLRELQLTIADLAAQRLVTPADRPARTRADGVELSRVQRIDARFHDQIVVSLTKAKT
jgi:hypothetical protein